MLTEFTGKLKQVLEAPDSAQPVIDQFLSEYWRYDERPDAVSEADWDVLGNLALDLEYYEPNDEYRSSYVCLFDGPRAVELIKDALIKLGIVKVHTDGVLPNKPLQLPHPKRR